MADALRVYRNTLSLNDFPAREKIQGGDAWAMHCLRILVICI